MKILIGNTGLIGQTLQKNINFDLAFNSKNINQYNNYQINNSELYLSCLPATKWIVNKNIIQDIDNIYYIFNIIKNYKYSKIILISTIDIYNDSPLHSNEDNFPVIKSLSYGSNRYLFELLINQLNSNNIKIIRLPALFNNNIKKNILFDLLNNNNIPSINFNSKFQWYNLDNLCNDINNLDNISIINLFNEPLETEEILKIFNLSKKDVSCSNHIIYDFKTKYTSSGYIKNKHEVLSEIKKFVYEYSNKSFSI